MRVHDRDVRVRVWTEPFAVVAQRRAGGREVTVGLFHMPRLQQQSHRYRRQSGVFELLDALDKVWTRRPCKVVHIFCDEVMSRLAIALRQYR